MKRFFVISILSGILLTACGNANVTGKHFENVQIPSSIDFDTNTNRVFYLTDIGTYTVDKNNIVINLNNKEIKLVQKSNTLYVYMFDDNGNQTNEINNSLAFYDKGISNFFTNYFTNSTKNIDGVQVNFTDKDAQVGDNKIEYSFNTETAKYEVEGYEATYNRNQFLSNIFDNLVSKVLNDSTSKLSYEKAWWLRQKVDNAKISDNLIKIYAKSFYTEKYNKVKTDEFALHKLIEEIKPEFTEKFNSVNTKEIFTVVQPVELGNYDFDNNSFTIKSDMNIPEIKSTFLGDELSISPRLCFYNKSRFSTQPEIKWLSGINTELSLKMDEKKAEELKNKDNNYLIVYKISPVMTISFQDSMSENEYDDAGNSKQARYIQYYQLKSAELIESSTLNLLGDVEVKAIW